MTPGPYRFSLQLGHTSYIWKGKAEGWVQQGRARRGTEVLRVADRDVAVADQQSREGEERTETKRPGATGAAPDLPRDSRPERLRIEKHSSPIRCLLGWEARRRRASRRAQLAAPRGRALQNVPRSGGHSPQAWTVHSGHGTWAGAAGWPRGRNRAREIWKAGKGRARRNGEVEKREGANTGREALKKEAGKQTQGGT